LPFKITTMKIALSLFCAIVLVSGVYAQSDTTILKTTMAKSDRMIVDVFTDLWQGVPDSITAKGLQLGMSAKVMRDFPLGKSNFSFALGIGISAHNFHSNGVAGDQYKAIIDTATQITTYEKTGLTVFTPLPKKIGSADLKYQRNKINVAYVEIPIEFRFRTKAEGAKFKVALGGKFGYLIGSHSKYKGDDYWTTTTTKDQVKVKYHDINNIAPLSYAATLRVGYGFFNVCAAYSLSTLFDKDKGPEMSPISVGISIVPF
jgi:hypothetical protein